MQRYIFRWRKFAEKFMCAFVVDLDFSIDTVVCTRIVDSLFALPVLGPRVCTCLAVCWQRYLISLQHGIVFPDGRGCSYDVFLACGRQLSKVSQSFPLSSLPSASFSAHELPLPLGLLCICPFQFQSNVKMLSMLACSHAALSFRYFCT